MMMVVSTNVTGRIISAFIVGIVHLFLQCTHPGAWIITLVDYTWRPFKGW